MSWDKCPTIPSRIPLTKQSLAYNLGWKLASVIKHRSDPLLLKTYEAERRKIARELIAFDHEFSRLFSGRPSKDILDNEGIDLETFKQVFEKGNLFTNGTSVDYDGSIIVSKVLTAQESKAPEIGAPDGVVATSEARNHLLGKQHLATGIRIGMRMPSFKVLNQSDARPWHFQELLPSNGCWRIVVFAGDLRESSQFARFVELGQAFASTDSFLHRYSPNRENIDSVFEVITVHSAPRSSVELPSLPEIFHPFSEDTGWDYNKVFVDDISYHEGHGHAYMNYGIDPRTGCMIIIRPDQHVSWIGDLEDIDSIESFFAAFMIIQ